MRSLPTLRRLQLFERLGCLLNFHRTAEATGIAQPALTRAIRQLEDELGFPLFTRTTRTTQLTPAGQVLHVRVQQWLREMESVIADCRVIAHGEQNARLRLGYSAQASHSGMSQLLFQFGLRHPKTDLTLRQLPSEEAYQEIAAGSLDGAFLIYDDDYLSQLGLDSVPLESQRVVAVCSASHPLASRGAISATELSEWGVVMGSQARWQVFRKAVLKQLGDLGVSPTVIYEADDTPLLLEVLAHSHHVCLYGSGLAHHLPGHLVSIALRETIELPLCFAFGKGEAANVQALAQFVYSAPTA